MKFIGIIPARYASTRFPGKPLADIDGVPMIIRVVRQALKALDTVVVATDDARIYDEVKHYGYDVVMTSTAHRSGTDRCLEAYDRFGYKADVIINIQGDEPFIHPEQIEELKSCYTDESVTIATLIRQFPADGSYSSLSNPNSPKVVIDDDRNALYFSRSVIPYLRGKDCEDWPRSHQYYTHVGMYAYRAETLRAITALPQSTLELAESLEQLRWLQAGYKIKTGITSYETVGIDTLDDLDRAVAYLRATYEHD